MKKKISSCLTWLSAQSGNDSDGSGPSLIDRVQQQNATGKTWKQLEKLFCMPNKGNPHTINHRLGRIWAFVTSVWERAKWPRHSWHSETLPLSYVELTHSRSSSTPNHKLNHQLLINWIYGLICKQTQWDSVLPFNEYPNGKASVNTPDSIRQQLVWGRVRVCSCVCRVCSGSVSASLRPPSRQVGHRLSATLTGRGLANGWNWGRWVGGKFDSFYAQLFPHNPFHLLCVKPPFLSMWPTLSSFPIIPSFTAAGLETASACAVWRLSFDYSFFFLLWPLFSREATTNRCNDLITLLSMSHLLDIRLPLLDNTQRMQKVLHDSTYYLTLR